MLWQVRSLVYIGAAWIGLSSIFVSPRLTLAELPPAGGYRITEVGLTGAAYESVQGGGFIRETLLAGLNNVGHVIGRTTRYPGLVNSWGTDSWFFNGTTTQLIGLTGTAYQYDEPSGIKRSSTAISLNENDEVIGVTARLGASGANLGQDAWLFDGSATKILGLFGGGYQYATGGGTYRFSATSRLIDAGQAIGNSKRFASSGATLGADAWVFDGQITQIVGLTGIGYEYAATGGTHRSSDGIFLNQAGYAAGASARYGTAGLELGKDAWRFDGATTSVIGLTGTPYEYTAGGGTYRFNYPSKLNQVGQVVGTATRYDANGQARGHDAWLSTGNVSQRIGLVGGEYIRPDLQTAQSDPWAINYAGVVIGDSERYIYYPQSGFFSAGQDAWLFNGTTTRLIGLTDSTHRYVQQYGISRASHAAILNNNNQAAGTSRRYGTSGEYLGQDAWLTNDVTTLPIGLSGNGFDYSTNGGTYRFSEVRALNDLGQAIGTTTRYSPLGNLLGDAGWFFNPQTGVSTPLEFSTSAAGYSSTTPRTLTDTGVVLGDYLLYNGDVSESRLFWWSPEAGFRDLGGLVAGGLDAAGWEKLVNVTNGTVGVVGGTTQFLYGNGVRTGQVAPMYPPGIGVGYSAYLLTAQTALPGDYNGNGLVDTADYVVWRNTNGQAGAGLAADGNGDGFVDTSDYNFWRSRFGQIPASSSSVATAVVPEPTSFFLMASFWFGEFNSQMQRGDVVSFG